MDADVIKTLGPPILLVIVLVILIFAFRHPIANMLYEARTTTFEFSLTGIKFQYARTELDNAIEKKKVTISHDDRLQAVYRLSGAGVVFKNARILWVDDNPDNNIEEQKILSQLDVCIDNELTSEEAEERLRRAKNRKQPYDAVISDLKREGNDKAGMEFAERISNEGLFGRTIIYTGSKFQGMLPPYLHGATNRPNDLFHLIADVLERERWKIVAERHNK